jgi:hypothetical protein
MNFIHYLETLTGVSIYPLASLCIFTVFFVFAAGWAFKADKKMMEQISHIPLDSEG